MRFLVTAALGALVAASAATADRACAPFRGATPIAPAAAATPFVLDSEPVRLNTRDGRRLEGTFYAVPKEKDPTPAVLLVHDLGATREQLAPVVERLVKKKLAVLCFDLRGHGASADEQCDWSKLDDEQKARLAPFMVHDVGAAMEWLMDDPRVAGVRQHLVGQGFGALLAARAATDERVTSLTLLEPELEHYGFVMKSLLPEAAGLPTQIVVVDEKEKEFGEFVVECEVDDFVEVQGVKAEPGRVVEDKRFGTSLSKWVDERRDGRASGGGERRPRG